MSNMLASRRGPGPVGQFQTIPVKAIVRFLTIPYICAQRILHLAREVQVFHMISMHIARQALHLVILLNDQVDATEGPSEEQQDERIDLGDDLIELEEAMKLWGRETEPDAYDACIPEITQQYAKFFKKRFYFNDRDPDSDPVLKKLLAYDDKTRSLENSLQSIGHQNSAEVQAAVESLARISEESNVPISVSHQPPNERYSEETLKISDNRPSFAPPDVSGRSSRPGGGDVYTDVNMRFSSMNVQADMDRILSKMKMTNTTNPRAFRELKRRAENIAAHLEKSQDTAQQKELLGIFIVMADQFDEATGGRPDTVSSRMDPHVSMTRRKLIMSTDEKLDQFQPPPPKRLQVMQKATADDAKSLGIQLTDLATASDGLLKALNDSIGTIPAAPAPKAKSDPLRLFTDAERAVSRAIKIEPVYMPEVARRTEGSRWDDDTPRSLAPAAEHRILKHNARYSPNKTPFLQDSGSKVAYQPTHMIHKDGTQTSDSGALQWLSQTKPAHDQLEKKLVEVQNVIHMPSLSVPISDMCFENGVVMSQNILLDQTFGELADLFTNNDPAAVLPDFWSKKIDHDRNRVTRSGVVWEWQDPGTRILDVITRKNKDGKPESLAIEKVAIDGEYVVALVEKDKKEGPMSVEIPQAHHQSAYKHFQKVVFPYDDVSRVLELQSGDDASKKLFDRRVFIPYTNPVFIEVRGGSKEIETGTSALHMDVGLKASSVHPTTIVRGSPGFKEKQRPFSSKLEGEGIPGLAEIRLMVSKGFSQVRDRLGPHE